MSKKKLRKREAELSREQEPSSKGPVWDPSAPATWNLPQPFFAPRSEEDDPEDDIGLFY